LHFFKFTRDNSRRRRQTDIAGKGRTWQRRRLRKRQKEKKGAVEE
jgi:hypothetical protein